MAGAALSRPRGDSLSNARAAVNRRPRVPDTATSAPRHQALPQEALRGALDALRKSVLDWLRNKQLFQI